LWRAAAGGAVSTDSSRGVGGAGAVSTNELTEGTPPPLPSMKDMRLSHDGSFPVASEIENPIIQIGCVFQKYGEPEPYKKIMLSLKDCDQFNDVNVLSFESEPEMLLAFKDIIRKEDPDIITGYNIYGFDEKYIAGRAKINRIDRRIALGEYYELMRSITIGATENINMFVNNVALVHIV
jgi:DNA polymerase elongation subunit (family B)